MAASTTEEPKTMAVFREVGALSDLKNLFPTKVHFFIFVGYMALFISQGMLVELTPFASAFVIMSKYVLVVGNICLQTRKPILLAKTCFAYLIFTAQYSVFNLWLVSFQRSQLTSATIFFPTGILVTATKDKDNHYAYNTVTVVLLTEFVKLLVAVGLQLRT